MKEGEAEAAYQRKLSSLIDVTDGQLKEFC